MTKDAESDAASRGTVAAILGEMREQLDTVAYPEWTVAEVRSVAIYLSTLVDDLLEALGPEVQHNDGEK